MGEVAPPAPIEWNVNDLTPESAFRMVLKDDPHVDWRRENMEFRLTYAGQLLSETKRDTLVRRARAERKHIVRRAFHHQLKRWWEVSPYLKRQYEIEPGKRVFGSSYPAHSIDNLAGRFARFGYNFVPLVTRELEVFCSVKVLYLRFGKPGDLFNREGDIDARLKTLFDALTVPRDARQVGSFATPSDDEVPFFCLLEDDSLITTASVDSDVLLEPVSQPPDQNDARLVISIKIRPGRVKAENIGFA